MRSITNVLAQCRFYRISKMTSSDPHPTSPLGLAPSPHGLAHLPPSSRFPSHLPLEPFHTPLRSLVLLQQEYVPAPTLHPLSPYPPPSSSRPRYPPASPCVLAAPLLSRGLSSLLIFFFILPSSISRLSSLTNYRRTQFRRIKASAAYYRRSVIPTRRTRIPTNRNADGLRYRRAA